MTKVLRVGLDDVLRGSMLGSLLLLQLLAFLFREPRSEASQATEGGGGGQRGGWGMLGCPGAVKDEGLSRTSSEGG